MKSVLTLVALLAILWSVLALSGASFALTTKPQSSSAGGLQVCRYVTAWGLVDQPAFGLNPTCGPMDAS